MEDVRPIEPQVFSLEAVLESLSSVGEISFESESPTTAHLSRQQSDIVVNNLRSPTWREKAHLRAAYYWLKLYLPSDNPSPLERMRGYLEAAHHLREIQAWELVAQILHVPLDERDSTYLWRQLGDCGLFREQIELYLPLVGKIDEKCDRLCWEGLGEAYIHLCQYPEAIAAWESLLQLGWQKSHLLLEAKALEGLARTYGSWGQYRTAKTYAEQSLACLKAAPSTSDLEAQKAKALATMSYIAIHLRQYRLSIACGEEALAIARYIGDAETQWYALGRLAVSYGQQGQGQKALQLLEEQYQQRYQNQDLRQVSALLINLTLLCCYQRKLKLASQYVRESWEMHREIGDANGQCYALLMSGFIQLWQDNYDSAAAYFQQSLSQAQVYGYKHHMAIALSQLSYIDSGNGDLNRAYRQAKRALAMARKTDNAFFTASGLAALGLVYWAQGRKIKGLFVLIESIFTVRFWANGDGKLMAALIAKRLWQPVTSLLKIST